MSNPAFEIEISMEDQKVKLKGISQSNAQRPVTFDYIPPVGTGQGYAGLELLTMSFSGCVSTALLFLLRKSGVEISDFKAHVQGFRREKPLSLEKIVFEAEIKSPNAQDAVVRDAMGKLEALSPVWRSLNKDITVETSYILTE
ncbi:MAG: OsmC family protein [Clostridia bacterium]|nr:OsmC family protein [Clostridia bacterium]MDR3645605.1 OsmC family protein [Clostridia bacterium]